MNNQKAGLKIFLLSDLLKKMNLHFFEDDDIKTSPGRFSSILAVFFLILISFFSASVLATGKLLPDFRIPFVYSYDTLGTLAVIQRIIDGGWYFHSNRLGFPFGSEMFDYPIPDYGSLLFFKIFGSVTGNCIFVYNLFYFIGFPLDAVVAFFVFRKLRLNTGFSVAGALLFTFAPFHFLRIGHLFYTWYFVVPLAFYMCIRVFSETPPFFEKQRTKARIALNITLPIIIASFGVYYAFFSILLLCSSGVVSSLHFRSIKPVLSAAIAVVIVSGCIGVYTAPNNIDSFKNGKNMEVAQRNPYESEIYGLKIVQLLLPRPDHRVGLLNKLTMSYSRTTPLVNENYMSSLGFLGSLGFIMLLGAFFLAPFYPDIKWEIRILALLTVVMVLFSTIGGFSSLFALLISPSLRGWSRISIFIQFAALTAFFLFVQIMISKISNPFASKFAPPLLCILFLITGVWDQTAVRSDAGQNAMVKQFKIDRDFIQRIEKISPSAAIFQMPYMQYPEVPPLNHLDDYGLFLGFLHSSTLKWSYGGMKGRTGDGFYQALSEQPLEKQIEVIKKLGFSGIYLDRRGYLDGGRSIELGLSRMVGKPIFESSDSIHVFYQLPEVRTPDLSGKDSAEIMQTAGFFADRLGIRYHAEMKDGIDFRKKGLPDFVKDIKGISTREEWGRWSIGKKMRLVFTDVLPRKFTLILKASAFGPNAGDSIRVMVGNQSRSFSPVRSMAEYRLDFLTDRESNEIVIFIAKPMSPSRLGLNEDPRLLGIGMESIGFEF